MAHSEEPPATPKVGLTDDRPNSVPATPTRSNIDEEGFSSKRADLSAVSAEQNAAPASSVPAVLTTSTSISTTIKSEAVVPGEVAPQTSLVPTQTPKIPMIKSEPGTDQALPPLASTTKSKKQGDAIKSEQCPEVPALKAHDSSTNPDSKASVSAKDKLQVKNNKSQPWSKESLEISWNGLRGIADSTDLSKLELAVETAKHVLDSLHGPMTDFKRKDDNDLGHWITSIDNLKNKAQKAGRTVIAVAGGTGAGKSSLINAVLDEDRLLPTNGMRACTAVITEVSWNEIDDPKQAYRAEIEYVSQQDWESELELLFDELLDDNKNLSPAWRDANSEAAIALSKVKSVYPELTDDMIVRSGPKDLAQVEAVRSLLGTKQRFSFSSAEALYSELSVRIDSKEKGSRKKTGLALWPLIRVVKIYVRSDALSTGVVLVDLPGTADSNAARGAVASRYLAECTAVWVVSRIARAVDDKAASELLGKSSRIQMKMDGSYSTLTFVATQTDGIDIQETKSEVDKDGAIEETFIREKELDAMIQQAKSGLISEAEQRQRMDELWAAYDAVAQELAEWQSLEKKLRKGQVVSAPAAKRAPVQPKRRRMGRREIPVIDSDDESDKVPLTQEQISAKLKDLDQAFTDRDAEATAAEQHFDTACSKLRSLEQQKADLVMERARICVQRRNNYCRDQIRLDFAAGIKDIDEEDSATDPEYDPSIQKRDYTEVARSLPVFCISSKAYQQLRKKTSCQSGMEGFTCTEDSEIPGLKNHAKASALAGQLRSNKAYLNQFSQVMNSLTMWTNELSLGAGQCGMSEETKAYELKVLGVKLEELEQRLADSTHQTKKALGSIIEKNLASAFIAAGKHASKQVEDIAGKWGLGEKKGGYGLAYGTYRAICKRGGEKTASKKSRNFNEDLSEPFLQKIAGAWEQAFARDIPTALDKFAISLIHDLRSFHALMASRSEMKKGRAALAMLARQVEVHEATIKDAINDVKTMVIAEQRDATHLFIPEIKAEMNKVYTECGQMKGPGVYMHMRDTMTLHLKKNRTNIFNRSRKKVEKALKVIFQDISASLTEECTQIRTQMASDYKIGLTSAETIEVQSVIRDCVRKSLQEADLQFDAIFVGAEPMEVDQPAETAISGAAAAPNATSAPAAPRTSASGAGLEA